MQRPELGWPMTAMMRYRHYADSWHLIGDAAYVYSIDVDCLFVAPVGEEVLSSTVGTTHADNAHYDGTEFLNFAQKMKPSGSEKGGMWLQVMTLYRSASLSIYLSSSLTPSLPASLLLSLPP